MKMGLVTYNVLTLKQSCRRMDGWMDGMDGWMFFKILVPRLHVPAGAFFCEERHFLKKVYFLKNQIFDFYEKYYFVKKTIPGDPE